MTLVVARSKGGHIGIVADTLVSFGRDALPLKSPELGVVKSCFLPGGLCVSFAHSPEGAQRAFKSFLERHPNGLGYADAITFFTASSRETDNEYILAFATTGKLVKITDGSAMRPLGVAWIGDADAYNRFREYAHKRLSPPWRDRAMTIVMSDNIPTESPAHDLAEAMRCVVADREVQNVGGFFTSLPSSPLRPESSTSVPSRACTTNRSS
jgi:hypothetical protein